ncbi:uncharacterized protein LAESUDRAFT_728112 [Laetiporus sulphureus 93-53]|uniref:Uncharacterized protein n=1 Tax=Laetiporus sulphureus 93-53 TaxID=1314785 RepID=A0A165D853_9APHY|nr:uncharacterized protein LAESUDRAFT_728112 [Laetiporus sulphureus 93-53]KZT04302.1 hypothetical protein LAESUDRAFT_728112 [Laetiporus sulphureus 93-53]
MQSLSRRHPENSTAGSTPYIRCNATMPPEPPSAPENSDVLPTINNTLMNSALPITSVTVCVLTVFYADSWTRRRASRFPV